MSREKLIVCLKATFIPGWAIENKHFFACSEEKLQELAWVTNLIYVCLTATLAMIWVKFA